MPGYNICIFRILYYCVLCVLYYICNEAQQNLRARWGSRKTGLKGKATLKENIIKMKDILFPNILVQVS